MNIKELKEKIKGLDETLDVFINQNNDEFPNSLCNDAQVKEIKFIGNGVNKKEEPNIKCFIISDN